MKNSLNNLQWGFEIECIAKSEKIFNQLKKDLVKINPKIIIDDDGSIEPEDEDKEFSMEIKTPCQKSREALKTLEKVFNCIKGKIYTNWSCGFHANVSFLNGRKIKKFNPMLFLTSPIWNKLLKDFNREDNDYCTHPNFSKDNWMYNLNELSDISFDEKYSCVNLSGYNPESINKYSRIEIRGFGNKNYEKKPKLISNYLGKIANLMHVSHS